MTWMPTSRAISSYFSAGACKRRAARLRQTRSSSPRAACCQTNAQSRTRCSCDDACRCWLRPCSSPEITAPVEFCIIPPRRPWSNPAMTGIKSLNFRPLVLYQGPLGSTLHPVMAGLDPAIATHMNLRRCNPSQQPSRSSGRVKPSQDGSGGACGKSTARAAGIRSARRANNLYSVKLRPLFRETPCWVY